MGARQVLRIVLAVSMVAVMLAGCGGDDDGGEGGDGGNGGDGAGVPFTLHLEPEFVQGAIPGATTGVLVAIESASNEPVALTATATEATVTVTPASLAPGGVAEVLVVAEPGAMERPMEIVVTGRRGESESTDSRSLSVLPWPDDRGDYARTLLGLFTAWLEQNEPALGISPSTSFEGSVAAPGLLVVSHYLFLSESWEIGLSWHVMIQPDDWSEIYLRPRDELKPTHAFRLSSQSAALSDGLIEITAVPPPAEVVR